MYTDTPQKKKSKNKNKQQPVQKMSEQEKWCSSGWKGQSEGTIWNLKTGMSDGQMDNMETRHSISTCFISETVKTSKKSAVIHTS